MNEETSASLIVRRARLGLATVLAVVVAVGLVLQLGKGALQSAGVVEPVQRYVAMDFPRPGDLPGEFIRNEPMSFVFRVVNEEGRSLAVPWEVRIVPSKGKPYLVARGRCLVRSGRSSTVKVVAAPRGHWSTATVEVELPGSGDAPLLFHITELVAAGGN